MRRSLVISICNSVLADFDLMAGHETTINYLEESTIAQHAMGAFLDELGSE